MDLTQRQITKIARDVNRFTVQAMRENGVGTAEFDFIHYVRHHPGATQSEVCEATGTDKGAGARRAANLEAKGYLKREINPCDGRSRILYATEKAEKLKNSKANVESAFYEWLTRDLCDEEKKTFCATLDKLYNKAKEERKAGFVHLTNAASAEDHES